MPACPPATLSALSLTVASICDRFLATFSRLVGLTFFGPISGPLSASGLLAVAALLVAGGVLVLWARHDHAAESAP